MRRTGALLWAAFVLCAPAPARAAEQTLVLPSPGWHFVALQVRPDDPDPAAVFPAGGGFDYDHLWSFDPEDGWRYFTPDPGVPDLLLDLVRIEPLRGHWIHVTSVPPGGASLVVQGETAVSLRLEPPPASPDGWHAIGALLDPAAARANVETVFGALGPALASTVLDVWAYDGPGGSLRRIDDFAADCALVPGDCLERGPAYWARIDGTVVLGSELRLSRDGVVLSGESPSELLRVAYAGAGPVLARLRALDPDAGIGFTGAAPVELDELTSYRPDRSLDPAGPDAQADLDDDGSAEDCPDACAGLASCVSLCFASGGQEHALYASVDVATLASLQQFTSLAPGREHTRLLLEVVPPPSSLQPGVVGPLPDSDVIVADVPLALRPAVLRGLYSGVLVHDQRRSGEVPVRMWLDDCVVDSGSGLEDCSGGAVAVINPTVLASRTNGIDDDGDENVDELGEEGPVPTRSSPGFPRETVLRGEVTPDRLRVRLSGAPVALPGLEFASGRCTAGQCAGTLDPCSVDADCDVADAGLALGFAGATRALSLDLYRSGPESFEGFFSDHFDQLALGATTMSSSAGSLVLQRVERPQCVAPSGAPGVPPLVLGVDCRDDADCPGRCTGSPEVEGFSCFEDADCSATLAGSGTPVSGTCERLSCAFTELAPGASADARLAGSATLDLGTLDRTVVVELAGATTSAALADPASGGSVSFAGLACGSVRVRVIAPGCDPLPAFSFDPCVTPQPVVPALQCPGAPAPLPVSSLPASTDGVVTLSGGVALTSPLALTGGGPEPLLAIGGEPVVAGPDPFLIWTDVASWPAVTARVRAGLLELLQ